MQSKSPWLLAAFWVATKRNHGSATFVCIAIQVANQGGHPFRRDGQGVGQERHANGRLAFRLR